jgi:hypothetical protein
LAVLSMCVCCVHVARLNTSSSAQPRPTPLYITV